MTANSDPSAELSLGSHHCITCGDDGDPMTVLAVDEVHGLAVCTADDEVSLTVEIALVAPVRPGDRLLVHAGTAIAQLFPDDDDPGT